MRDIEEQKDKFRELNRRIPMTKHELDFEMCQDVKFYFTKQDCNYYLDKQKAEQAQLIETINKKLNKDRPIKRDSLLISECSNSNANNDLNSNG